MNSLRVLLVDQDANESERVAGRLERADHTVLPASGLDEAAQVLEIQRVDAVVVNAKLVSEQLRSLRSNLDNSVSAGKPTARIPFVCYAATPSDQPSESALAHYQVDACLMRDFEAPAFSQLISSLAALILARQLANADQTRPALPVFRSNDFQEQLGFDRDLVNEILDLFFTEAKRQSTEMQSALQSGDLLNLSRTAHSIKGSLGSLHAPEAAARAQDLEQIAKAEDIQNCAAALAELELALKVLEPELLQLRNAEPGS